MATIEPTVTLIPGTLDAGWCPSTWQEVNDEIIGRASASWTTQAGGQAWVGANVPTADYNVPPDGGGGAVGAIWHRTVNNAYLRSYNYYNGFWLSEHPIAAEDDERKIWVGDASLLWQKDSGSESVTPGAEDRTGPWWEVDSDFAGRTPVGAGQVDTDGTDWSVGTAGGATTYQQTAATLPSHVHGIGLTNANIPVLTGYSDGSTWNTANATNLRLFAGAGPGTTSASGATGNLFTTENVAHPQGIDDTEGTTKIKLEQPGWGCYMIKRTARRYYAEAAA